MSAKPRIKIPKSASKGEIITVKTLIKHVMHSGFRRDAKTGEKIPRMIIHSFDASFNGKPIINIKLEGSVSSDPFLEFTMKAEESGELLCIWKDDEGSVFEKTAKLKVK